MSRPHDSLDIHLLGGFSLAYGGDHLAPLPSRHARLLFAWLALQAGRPQSRTLLADRFWPDLPEARGRRRLSHALWQVQDSFGELRSQRSYLVTRGDEVAFDVTAPYWLDVEEFEQRIDEVDESGEVDAAAVRHLRRVVHLYGGDLLAGNYEPWVLQEQERLRQRYIRALHRLASACERRGNFQEALAVARRLTHEAPLREDAHRSVMRLCVLVGQPSQALEQFERCRSVLAEELGASPSTETVRLHDSIAHSRTTGPQRAPATSVLETRTLVGRDDERVRLVDQFERTLGGSAGTAFVEGEPGVGKTHLLVRAAEDARWRGFTVVWGTCEAQRGPFSWLREALLPVLDGVRVTQLSTVVAPVWLHEAARLLPPLRALDATPPPRPALSGADGAERMRQALTHVLTGLATIDPLAVFLENVHRADADTFALLRTLARHPDPGRLALVVSFRDVEARADGEVWSALRALDRDAGPVRVSLRPLDAFATGSLLGEALRSRHVPPRFVERVHRETGGNPLYALELLRALRDEGELDDDTDGHLETVVVPVTRGLRTLVEHRLAMLGEDETAVAEQAAVLGSEFSLHVLASASQLSARARTVALGELVRRNLLEIDDEDARFTHAATRTVLLERVDADRTRRLHAAAARAIEAQAPEAVEPLAAHLLVADPARATAPLRVAAEQAIELHAYARAADHLTTAVQVAANAPMDVAERLDLLLTTESVLDVLGRRDEQARVLDALGTLRSEDPTVAVELGIRQARHLGHRDRFGEALAVAEATVAAARAHGEPVLQGRALTVLGHVHGWGGDQARAVEVLRGAADAAADDPAAAADALDALGTALRQLQRFDEAHAALLAARDAASSSGDEALIANALGTSADIHAETGSTAEAAALHERAVAIARRIGFRYREGVSLVNLGTIRLMRGEPGLALRAYDEAAAVFSSLGNTRGSGMVALNRAWLLHRWLGRDADATSDANAARDRFDAAGTIALSAIAMETLAGVARRRGDHDVAHGLLDRGLAAARDAGDQRAAVQLLRGRAELALVADDPGGALAAAEEALTAARAHDLREFVADVAALGALAAARRGNDQVAAELAAVADAHLPTSAERHRVHHLLGLVAGMLGRDDAEARHHGAARDLLDEALAGLDERDRLRARDDVTTHRAIAAAAAVHAPRVVELRLARLDAPRGRALEPAETVAVSIPLPPLPDGPAARREQLLGLLAQVADHGAEATVDDLSEALKVSESTVRRDLRALRAAGHEVGTRGSSVG